MMKHNTAEKPLTTTKQRIWHCPTEYHRVEYSEGQWIKVKQLRIIRILKLMLNMTQGEREKQKLNKIIMTKARKTELKVVIVTWLEFKLFLGKFDF